ncbi:MAG: hypothetical protein AMJ75_08145 [Phycisphaerae bacterium SM1_79]|nr:MAG: hypothetical protein AMJ75_08145 [Phycisphaerae bacterium SM1_79]
MCKKLFCLACLFVVLSVAGNATGQILVHYKLDETSGNIAVDSSGKGNDGVIGAEPNWVEGWIDGALNFSENDANCITLPADRMGLRSDTGTVAFWVNMTEVAGGINTIWWGGDNTTGGGFGPENEMHIQVEIAVANIWVGGEFGFYLRGDPNNVHLHSDPNKGDAPGVEPVTPILLPDGQWHHIAGTWGNEDGNAKLYFDGKLLHEIPYDWTKISYPLTNIYIGQMANGSRVFNGLLDEVQIYGGALTAEQVQIVMAGGEIINLKAALPEPANQGTDVPRDTALSWMAGDRADTHNVYFGDNFDDVSEASVDDPRGVLFGENLADNTFVLPDLLEFNKTYYWRVDEVNAPPESGINRGNVWSFTTVNFVVVDDFEGYTDYAPDDIFTTWKDGYGTDDNGALIGYDAPDIDAGEHFVETTIIHGGTQSMPYFYNNDGKYSEAWRTLDSISDWTADDIASLSLWFRGNPPYVGSFTEDPAGTYTITSTGTDIWAGSDEFHFAFKQADGAVKIIARVDSLQNTQEFAKAGVMIRDTLDPDSKYVGVFITPENGVRFQYRNAVGGVTERQFVEGVTAPQWVRLERTSGGLIRAYYSPDGNTWERFSLIQLSVTMPVYAGLAVTSHDINLTCEAVFSNVSFPDTNVGEQWTDQDIGMLSNRAAPLYVALSNSTGDPAVVYHDNPNVTQINAWTEWVIPLQAFADKGVDLTDVDKIAIGFGDKDNPQQNSGDGTMYFDDIRLYRPYPPVVIDVENSSFELPGTDKQAGFDNVPGWNTDGPCADSGVETGYTPTDGDWTAYLMSGDPSVWQLTGHTITEDDFLELKVDARITWAATTLLMTLYYDDNGTRVPIATREVTLTDAMQEYSLLFSAAGAPASVGNQIGIEFSNVSSGDTWIGLDNVRLVAPTE